MRREIYCKSHPILFISWFDGVEVIHPYVSVYKVNR
jgi:hypothetical protein